MDNILLHINQKEWYSDCTNAIKRQYGRDYILFSGLLSSTSPRFQVKRNFNTTLKIYNDYKKNKNLSEYFKKNKKRSMKKYKIIYAHYHNIIKVLDNGNRKGLKLSGLKVDSFYNNLIGDYGRITIDVWMVKLFKMKQGKPSKGDYILACKIVKAYRRKVKRLYNIKVTNASMQAILWQYMRSKEGLKPSNFNQHIMEG